MAGKKILGSNGLKRLRDTYFKNEGNFTHNNIDAILDRNKVIKEADNYGKYKMKDLYPDTYKTMTAIPDGLDVSQLRVVDGLFQGCESLTSVDGLDISSAVSAEKIFEDCRALKSVKGIKAPNARSWQDAFQGCKLLSAVEEMDTSCVTNFHGMFAECTSLPETFPWTLDMSNVTNPLLGNTSNLFGYSSVRSVTIKQNWKLNKRTGYYRDFYGNRNGNGNRTSNDPFKNYFFQVFIGEKIRDYILKNNIDTSTTATIDVPYNIGDETYTAKPTGLSDWAAESEFDYLRKQFLLFFSLNISSNSIALYAVNETEIPYTNADGTTETSTLKTIKTYDEDASNYIDAIAYDEYINRNERSESIKWDDGTTESVPGKSIVFHKVVEHILKPAINITWA